MIQMTQVYKNYPRITALSDINLRYRPENLPSFKETAGPENRPFFGYYSVRKNRRVETVVNGILITHPGFRRVYQLRRTMGIVFQDFRLLRDRTVRENIAFALEVTGHPQKEIKGRVSEILTRFGLFEREKDSVLALSAGEQQRVAIARALVNDPPLLLADEPTGNLDAQMTNEVMRIFADLHRRGTTILFATHDMNLIEQYPHRTIRLQAKGGRTRRQEKKGMTFCDM
jgi:cell division transport system ATP-binding protein